MTTVALTAGCGGKQVAGYSAAVEDQGALPLVHDLDHLCEVVQQHDRGRDLYVRWSRGPQFDVQSVSHDALTGVELPGLSANPLRVEQWWEDRSLRLWVARRLYDYEHLRDRQPEVDVRAWLLKGTEVARGPDNEPLVNCEEPIAWIAEGAMREARRLVIGQHGNWGTLDRGS